MRRIGRGVQDIDRGPPLVERCRCGATHACFVSGKRYPGQERADVAFACLACKQVTLHVLGMPEGGGAEVYLLSELPIRRIRWLPARSDYGISRRDVPLHRRLLASEVVPPLIGLVAGATVTIAMLSGRTPPVALPPAAQPRSVAPPLVVGAEVAIPRDAGLQCNQRECVADRIEDLRTKAAGMATVTAALLEIERALHAGDCARARELVRGIQLPEDTRLETIAATTSHLSLDLVLQAHCEHLAARAAADARAVAQPDARDGRDAGP